MNKNKTKWSIMKRYGNPTPNDFDFMINESNGLAG